MRVFLIKLHPVENQWRKDHSGIIMETSILADVLNQALMAEYIARDTYQKIIETFGPVRPFINIVESERVHIQLLLPLYEKYTIPLPPEPDPDRVVVPDSLLAACHLGVEAELANVAMYDRLIATADLPEVVEVLTRLQTASRDHHLPAFQRCVEKKGSPGRGQSFDMSRHSRRRQFKNRGICYE